MEMKYYCYLVLYLRETCLHYLNGISSKALPNRIRIDPGGGPEPRERKRHWPWDLPLADDPMGTLHVLPRGFVKIRYFGLWANRYRSAHLAHRRELLAASDQAGESAAILTSEQRHAVERRAD